MFPGLGLIAIGLVAAIVLVVGGLRALHRLEQKAQTLEHLNELQTGAWTLLYGLAAEGQMVEARLAHDLDALRGRIVGLTKTLERLEHEVPPREYADLTRAWERGVVPLADEALRRQAEGEFVGHGAHLLVVLERRTNDFARAAHVAREAAVNDGVLRLRSSRVLFVVGVVTLFGLGVLFLGLTAAGLRAQKHMSGVAEDLIAGRQPPAWRRWMPPAFRPLDRALTSLGEQLRENTRMQNRLASVAGHFTAVSDPDGALLHLDLGHGRLCGVGEEQLRDAEWPGLLHPEDARAGLEQIRRLLDEGGGRAVFDSRCLDGTRLLRWTAQAEPEEERVYLAARDVTEDVEALRGARAEAERFQRLLGATPGAICVVQDGGIVYANETLARGLGLPSVTELIGQDLAALEAGMTPEQSREVREALASDQQVVALGELPLLDGAGGSLLYEVVAGAVEIDGRPARICIGHDITEARRVRSRLAASERLGTLGLLAAGVAHEVNNPLSYMLGSVRELQARGPMPDQAALLNEVARGAESIARVVRALTSFSQVGPQGPPRRTSVQAALSSAVRLVRNTVRHRARLSESYETVDDVMAPPGTLGQVFLNLIVNAVEAIPAGDVEANRLAVRCFPREGQVVVEVEDTGEGIPEENLVRVFDPFFTTRPQGEGTGLGLAICSGIVQSCGGHIEVDTQVGRGTTFRVILPGAPGPALAIENVNTTSEVETLWAETPPSLDEPSADARLLLVDDDARVARALARVLRRHFQVDVVHSVADAKELLAQRSYGGIVCDLMMPGLSGDKLHEWLQVEHPVLAEHTLFVTGGAFTPAARQFLDVTTARCLIKPVDPDELLLAVEDLLAGASP